MVEYNGMWMLDQLYQNMPESWIVYQEFMFADSQTFLTYNTNMRGLVVDKLKSCEMVVLNRADERVDKVEIHKIIRAVSRRTNIAYEDRSGEVYYDDTPDELPYDINAPVISVTPGADQPFDHPCHRGGMVLHLTARHQPAQHEFL